MIKTNENLKALNLLSMEDVKELLILKILSFLGFLRAAVPKKGADYIFYDNIYINLTLISFYIISDITSLLSEYPNTLKFLGWFWFLCLKTYQPSWVI